MGRALPMLANAPYAPQLPAENVASWRVMEKIGLRREGHFRRCVYVDEATWWDEYFYALLEEDWFAGRPAAASGEAPHGSDRGGRWPPV